MLEDEYQHRGMTPVEARRAARLALGGVEQAKELHRDARSFPWLDDAIRDVQYAVRTLGRAPAFTAVAVVTLALGIGATTAIFSVARATLLRPLPYKHADRLVRIVENVPAEESPTGNAYRTSDMNQEALLWWRDHATSLSGVAAILKSAAVASIDGETVRVTVARVSPSIVTMLDATPVSGRLLAASDAHDHVAVLASSAWRRYFSNDPRAVDRTIVVDGVPHRIVGVAGPELATFLPEAEMWTPYVVESSATIRVTLEVVGQLRDGVSLAAASAEANVVGNAFIGAESVSGEASNRPRFEVVRVHDRLVEPVARGLRVLMALGGLVLLAVCTNLANLLLARGAARQRELAIRRSLGADRARLIRQMLTECATLSVAGSVAGMGLASGVVRLVRTLSAIELPILYGGSRFLIPRLEGDLIDLGVLIFTVLLCAVTGLAFGAIPALRLSDASPSSAPVWRPRHLQRWLTVGQLSLATLLLIGAGLFVHSFLRVATVDLGYDPRGALTFELVVPADLTNARKLALAKELTARLRSIPQVRAAGFTGAAPLATITGGFAVASPRVTPGSTFPIGRQSSQRAVIVSPGYLSVIGARLEEGRWLEPDEGFVQPPPAVINRSLARMFFGDDSPLGRSLRIGEILWQVVGVIEDVRSQGLVIDPAPQAYVDPDRFNDAARKMGWDRFGFDATPAFLSFAVRVDGNPASVVPDVRSIVRGLDSSAAVDGAIAMERVVAGELTRPRFYAALVTLLALLAAGLAAIGVYGVLSFLVALRTQEIGIRMALGAGRRDVVRLVIRDAGQMTAIGLALGLTGGAGLARYVGGLLFGIVPLDPTTFIGVSLIVILVAAFASWIPARRAAAVDPLTAIRYE